MLLRLNSRSTGEVRIYDLSNISEPDAVRDFIASTHDDDPAGSYLDFQVIQRHELGWWVRVGEEA